MKKRYPGLRKQMMILGLCLQTTYAAEALAAPTIPGYYGDVAKIIPPSPTALPTGGQVVRGSASISDTDYGKLVDQETSKVVIHWQSYDLGETRTMRYNQQSKEWAALNVVDGNGYSKIFGKIEAQGRVYLLNQNGILFGPNSQINVHSFTASALNLDEEKFYSGPEFATGGSEVYTYQAGFPNNATVANYGTIRYGNLGSVFLLGPQVENHGTIEAPNGDIGLLAGGNITLSQSDSNGKNTNNQFKATVAAGGTTGIATNYETGRLLSDQGWTGMYGSFVNQEGLIRAVTALEANGRITLKASNVVHTGKNSVTSCPISDTGDRKVVDASTIKNSQIIMESDGSIEHYGQITAPTGDVRLTAKDRVYLAEGSAIDVSGSWVALAGDDRMIEVQLNSKEMRDAFIHKYGPLKGETVTVDTITGLSFADISDYLKSKVKSAPELTTKGGTITLKATGDNGEVIVKQGANLDFSGGGLIYGDGLVKATKVRIGQRIYDLANVPLDVPIDEVLGSFSHSHTRYGITDKWDGIYYGGSTAYTSYLPSFTQGADAGSLTIEARKTILDGTMNASVLRGLYQTALADPTDADGKLMATGRAMPKAGSLRIGHDSLMNEADLISDAIAIKATVAATSVAADGALSDREAAIRVSEISAERLNAAGLGKIGLYANQSVSIAPDATLNTTGPEAKVVIGASRIEHQGAIRAAGGEVNMSIYSTKPALRAAQKGLFLADTSRIDVSGQRLDNGAAVLGSAYQYGLLQGGSVTLAFNNEQELAGEVIMAKGAAIDVSGGYSLERGGKIKGGDAGSVSFAGGTVRPDGDLLGLALEGNKGGTVTIHTGTITVAKDGNLAGDLVLAEDRFRDTGFSNITLKSYGDLVVEKDVQFAPSSARLARPIRTMAGVDLTRNDTVAARDALAGKTSLSLTAGQKFLKTGTPVGSVMVEEGASLKVAPKGTITLATENGNVAVAGSLTALGGGITLTANQKVTLAPTARLDASGTVLDDPKNTLVGQSLNRQVVDGGRISLTATTGTVVMEQGSVVDVSGSEAVTNTVSDKKGGFAKTTVASAPGSVAISYVNDFVDQGELRAEAHLTGLPGGALSVEKTQTADNETSTMVVAEAQTTAWQARGFDDLTFSSRRALEFSESATDSDQRVILNPARKLTLNASEIRGKAGQDILLAAPWLRLTNVVPGTSADLSSQRTADGTAAPGTATLSATGDFIDIQGNVALSGFQKTNLVADRDIRLFDYEYWDSTKALEKQHFNSGALRTAGDLTMQAAAIYPGMYHDQAGGILPSAFAIQAGDAINGWRKITIEAAAHPENRQPIYSAGGDLTLEGGDIEQRGTLAAPMGTLTLKAHQDAKGAGGRVFLADNSLTSTLGETKILYGELKAGQWTVSGYKSVFDDALLVQKRVAVTVGDQSPAQGVSIKAKEFIQAPAAVIDLRGNDQRTPETARAGIFAYEFLPGFEGTHNPLAKTGRYVIMADNSVVLPGQAVYLEGVAGVPSGTYSLLPAEYAFLPGAKVIEFTGQTMLPGERRTTPAGYTMTAGYETIQGTAISSPTRQGILVRNASEVLAEGKFDTRQAIAGSAGDLKVTAATTIMAGVIKGQALPGYVGSTLKAAGQDITLGSGGGQLDSAWWQAFDFDTSAIPAALANKLSLDTAKLGGEGGGLTRLELGDAGTTKTITVEAGASLTNIAQVYLTAKDKVDLGAGAEIHALGDDATSGELVITSESVTAKNNTFLHASDLLQLNIDNLDPDAFKADLAVDHGTLGFAAPKIFLESENYEGSEAGIHLAGHLLDAFGNVDKVVLTSKSDLVFAGNVAVNAKNDLTLDAARITTANNGVADTITVNAGNGLRLQNSNITSVGNDAENKDSIAFSAKTITLGPNSTVTDIKGTVTPAAVTLDNFKTVSFASSGETVFNGKGTLKADLPTATFDSDGKLIGGELKFAASRFIATMTPEVKADDSLTFSPTDFTVDSGKGYLTFSGNDPKQEHGTGIKAMPGALTLKGQNITLNKARFELPAGALTIQAVKNIEMSGASILARGGAFNFPIQLGPDTYDNRIALSGGQVAMASTNGGTITIDKDSEIDTSATDGQAGGSISLAAGTSGVALNGTVKGDFFSMDTKNIDNFGKLATTLAAGGFKRQISLRARQGNVTIDEKDSNTGGYTRVTTENFKLVADGVDSTADTVTGKIDIYGTVDASATGQGGTIEMYANGDLTLHGATVVVHPGDAQPEHTGGQLLAQGKGTSENPDADADGGQIVLSSAKGSITTERITLSMTDPTSGGPIVEPVPSIYVAGNGTGKGGAVTYRVSYKDPVDQTPSSIAAAAVQLTGSKLDGTVMGAASQTMLALRSKNLSTVNGTNVATELALAKTFLNSTPVTAWRGKYSGVEVLPEIRFWSDSNMTVGTIGLNTLTNNRINGRPGVLSFQTAQNLSVTGDIIDAPTTAISPSTTILPLTGGAVDSWALNFVAGADRTSADPMAVKAYDSTTGNFTLTASKLIYTESAPIRIASGSDTLINKAKPSLTYLPGTNKYSVATFDGDINLNVGGKLTLDGGVIQSATGDIDVTVDKDLEMKNYGAIRTIGRAPHANEVALFNDPDFQAYALASGSLLETMASRRVWEFREGGNISIRAGKGIKSPEDPPNSTLMGWGYAYEDLAPSRLSRWIKLTHELGFQQDSMAVQLVDNYSKTVWETIFDWTRKYPNDPNNTELWRQNLDALQASLKGAGYAHDEQFVGQLRAALLPIFVTSPPQPQWGADYGRYNSWTNSSSATASTQAAFGFAAMGGGSVRVAAGGDIYAPIGAFKGGVTVAAGGDLDGRFLAMDGDLRLTAKGSFGTGPYSYSTDRESLVELGDSRLTINALGNIELGQVRNPTLAQMKKVWDLSYSQDSGVWLNAALGDITIQGKDPFPQSGQPIGTKLLPATLEARAGRDIKIDSSLLMAPSASGNLGLLAARDIDGPQDISAAGSTLTMSDADPATVYGRLDKHGNIESDHAPWLLHANDSVPVTVKAGRDIHDLPLSVPKRAEVAAQRDIRNLAYWGQNLRSDDVSLITAGRDIVQVRHAKDNDQFFMKQAGPGYLLIRAGNSMDLGSSDGIQSTGQQVTNTASNTGLGLERDEFDRVKGADVGVIVGYDIKLSKKEFSDFFAQLTEKGAEYSRLMATGKEDDKNAAARLKAEMHTDIIEPLLAGKQSGDGNITMTQSAMATNSGRDDLNILAAGRMEVGTTVLSTGTDSKVKGLQTFGGGNINVFSQETIDVNESRVVTNFGGNIFLLSNHGDLNAGRGSGTEMSSAPQGNISVGGKLVQAYGAPGVGSGVRTLSYDPDGAGPVGKPQQGNAYLIAWEGVVDAGEGGISGKDVMIAATKVLNSDNISFSDGGTGVPTNAAAGPSLGAMAGATTVSDTQGAAKEAGAMASSSKQSSSGNDLAAAMAEGFKIKLVVVKFVGFGEEINNDTRKGTDGVI